MSKGESKEYRTRLKEITSVLHKYGITRGITPQKLRMILEDLGLLILKSVRLCHCIQTFYRKGIVMN